MSKIFFVPYKPHIKKLLYGVAKYVEVYAADSANSTAQGASLKSVHKKAFGLLTLRSLVSADFQPPLTLTGLNYHLYHTQPEIVVCFDIYHWYTLQCLRYKRAHPESQLIIYAETKRWPRSFISRWILKFFLWQLRRKATLLDMVLVYTEDGKRFFEQELPGVPVKILPAPVDTEMFVPSTQREWLANDTLRILVNARYASYKRHQDVLQAVVRLQEQGKRCHVTCIGRADTGRERVEKLVAKFGLESEVTFHDPIAMDKLPALYHKHDVLVLPSYNEAIGMVVPEAMACGLPTVTSDTVGANVYVVAGETGLVHQTGDVSALAECLLSLHDATKLQQFGQAARTHVTQHYSVSAVAEHFADTIGLAKITPNGKSD